MTCEFPSRGIFFASKEGYGRTGSMSSIARKGTNGREFHEVVSLRSHIGLAIMALRACSRALIL